MKIAIKAMLNIHLSEDESELLVQANAQLRETPTPFSTTNIDALAEQVLELAKKQHDY